MNDIQLLNESIEAWRQRYYNSRSVGEMSHSLSSMMTLLREKRKLEKEYASGNGSEELRNIR